MKRMMFDQRNQREYTTELSELSDVQCIPYL